MRTQLIFRIKTFAFLALTLLVRFVAAAQTGDPMFDQFEQLMRRMDEQARRGMPVDTTFQGGRLQISPDSSSYFYFRVDTSFNGMGGSQFFQFSPFGDPGSAFPDMNRLLEQFFNGADPFQPRQDLGNLPPDDGRQNPEEDDLLPEERLRLQEENTKPQGKTNPPPANGSKVKTIRI